MEIYISPRDILTSNRTATTQQIMNRFAFMKRSIMRSFQKFCMLLPLPGGRFFNEDGDCFSLAF